MQAFEHLLSYSALQLVSGSLALLAASTMAAVAVFMVGFRLAGLPAGSVWVLLGLARAVEPVYVAPIEEEPERESGRIAVDPVSEVRSLASLGERVAAENADQPVVDVQRPND